MPIIMFQCVLWNYVLSDLEPSHLTIQKSPYRYHLLFRWLFYVFECGVEFLNSTMMMMRYIIKAFTVMRLNVSFSDTWSLLNWNDIITLMESKVFHMRLSEKELYRINILKQVYGYEKTPQLIRYWITRDIEKMLEDGRLRKLSSQSHSTPGKQWAR